MTTTQDTYAPDFLAGDEFTIPTFRLLQQDGTLFEGAEPPELDRDKARRIYRAMVFTRVLDERMMAAQRQGRLSFYMQCTGEEAAVIGAAAALDDADMIMAQYREQGALAYRGFTFDEFMNQLFGNELDYGKGRQMPIHYGSRKLHYLTISSPLATQIPQATGYAYGQKLAGDGHCTTVFFGEGAASEGDFHAALNMAAVHKVPVIFFCRNNGYAISTPAVEQFAADGVAPRAFGYRIHVIRVDGNDILAVYQATSEARRIAVEHNQPVLIEAMTYRMGPHSTADDRSRYQPEAQIEEWSLRDPIERYRRFLDEEGVADRSFYEDVDEVYTQPVYWPGTLATNPFHSDPMSRADVTQRRDQIAVFSEVSYDLTDKLTATVGGRYFSYDKRETFLREGLRFNVPFGTYSTINYASDFSQYVKTFKQWKFTNVDVEAVSVEATDFVYADPPYDVEFTTYSAGGFSWEDQRRTAELLAKHPGPVVISNQATPRIVELYQDLGFELSYLDGPRRISCTGDRTAAREVLAIK